MARYQKTKAKAAGDSSVSNGFFSGLSQNSTNLIIKLKPTTKDYFKKLYL